MHIRVFWVRDLLYRCVGFCWRLNRQLWRFVAFRRRPNACLDFEEKRMLRSKTRHFGTFVQDWMILSTGVSELRASYARHSDSGESSNLCAALERPAPSRPTTATPKSWLCGNTVKRLVGQAINQTRTARRRSERGETDRGARCCLLRSGLPIPRPGWYSKWVGESEHTFGRNLL